MSLKNASSRWYKQWSIANKLTFLYAFATLSILICITFLAFWTIHKVILTAETQYIIDEVHVIQDLISKHPGQLNALTQEVNAVPSALKDAEYRYYVRIYDDKNTTLMQTPGMQNALPDPKYPSMDEKNWQNHFIHWKSINNRHYLSMSAPVQFDNKGHANMFMQMAIDGTYPEELINNYRNDAILWLLAAIFIVIVLGRYIANQGLSRLYDLIYVTEKITAESLTERIQLNVWPKELAPLGQSINKMLERIETTFQRLSDCSTELAHELRTPINNIMLATEITLSRCRSVAEYKNVLESNFEEYRRFSSIIDNILFLAKTETNTLNLQKQTINAKHELNKIAEYYQITAAEKNISILVEGEGIIHAEPVMLQRAIRNLLANAVQHTPYGGFIHVLFTQTSADANIIIRDNGEGVSEDQLNLICERFYRVPSSLKYHAGGIGLGLSMVKSIMKLHNGNLEIQSELGAGTQVTLIFPHAHTTAGLALT